MREKLCQLFGRFFKNHYFGTPIIHPNSFVFHNASIIGDVIIDEDVLVASGARIRADEQGPFRICRGCNVQDGGIIHALEGRFVEVEGVRYAVYIGSHCSITHGVIIHGPVRIGKKVCVKFYAIVEDAIIGDYCFIDSKAIVRHVTIPPGRYVAPYQLVERQEEADALPEVSKELRKFNHAVVDVNKMKLLRRYTEIRRMERNPFWRIVNYLTKQKIRHDG